MKRFIGLALLLMLIIAATWSGLPVHAARGAASGTRGAAGGTQAGRFIAVDVLLDTGNAPLGSYQIDLTALAAAKFVGLEGGDAPAFKNAPYYDPAALAQSAGDTDHLIIAAFSTDKNLPSGKTRVARLHLHMLAEGNPEITHKLIVATNAGGETIPATITLRSSEGEFR